MYNIGICYQYEKDKLPQDIKDDNNWKGMTGSTVRLTVFSEKMENLDDDADIVEDICQGLMGATGDVYLYHTKDGRPFAVGCKH